VFKPLITITAALLCASALPAYAAPNVAPTVSITAPANNASVVGPATLTISATAADSDGSVTKVDFYGNGNLLGTDTTAPYSVTWSNVAVGNYSLTAKATDNKNATKTSTAVAVNVNAAPTVALTAPASNAGYTAPASVTLTAEATDTDGTVASVTFHAGATVIGNDTTAPYSVDWPTVAAGTYHLTATVNDDRGAQTTSAPVTIRVNGVPAITMTSPAANSIFISPATIPLSATAGDSDGTISQVEFISGTTVIGTAAAAPYTVNWASVPPGVYSITARATDNDGATTTTGPMTVTVNAAPLVDLIAPTPDSTFIAPATVALSATASDADGTVAKVEFFAGANFIASVTQAPYSTSWDNVPAGSYTITAKATDNLGAATTSPAAAITVLANTAPTVNLSAAPTDAVAPATITLTASASDADGSIARVDFFHGSMLLGSVTQPPYQFVWNDVPAGSYSVMAKATDNGGAVAQSNTVALSIAVPPPGSGQVYFIEADHLNTPRLVTDQGANTVWQWDNNDPFGNNVASGVAGFDFNLRFPGQYFDKETNLHYNYYRDYDPATGRYVQSDPIGLNGGLNTYGYADGSPTTKTDPLGLATYMCIQPLHFLGGTGGKSGPDISINPLHHQYLAILNPNGSVTTGGQDRAAGPYGPGKPSEGDGASAENSRCEKVEDDNKCIEDCLKDIFNKPRPKYALALGGIFGGQQCQQWSEDVLQICRKQCKK
jgi:RHS repeat-associated protein